MRQFEVSLLDLTSRSQAEAALRESEQGLRALIDASPHPIQFKDADGCWLLANPAMLELFELTGVDYRRKTDSELAAFSPFYRPMLIACGKADRALLQYFGNAPFGTMMPRASASATAWVTFSAPSLCRAESI